MSILAESSALGKCIKQKKWTKWLLLAIISQSHCRDIKGVLMKGAKVALVLLIAGPFILTVNVPIVAYLTIRNMLKSHGGGGDGGEDNGDDYC